MNIKNSFSKALLEGRLRYGYTQKQIADRVGISVRWYQKLESGERLPGTVTMLRLILLLHLDVETLWEAIDLDIPISTH